MSLAVILLIVAAAVMAVAFIAALCVIFGMRKSAAKNVELDDMTGLPNRAGFMRCGQAFLDHNKNRGDIVMLVFDVDNLGMINTLFGMECGDDVIRLFAKTAKEICAPGVCGRVNTDDFAILTCLGEGTPEAVINKFEQTLHAAIDDDVLREHVKFRAGVCVFDGHDDTYTLFNKANLCLMTAGADAFLTVFSADMERRMVENEILRSEMLDALNKGQFELYYQPKIAFKSGEIKGVEALIRWHHPVKGFIPPADFIPLAEQFGIITKIDEWGLITACRQCKKWQDMGLTPVKISVNMSQAQFIRTDVYQSVVKALEESGLEPKYLEIEVTETMAMTDVEHTVGILNRIHDLGVSISMDDFGTGYSSLASLKSFSFDVIKIDRSLVCDVEDNDASRRIAGAIVAMGKALHMVVLAEGVENPEQCEFLTALGCDLAQGYYYSKPRPASEIETMLLLPA